MLLESEKVNPNSIIIDTEIGDIKAEFAIFSIIMKKNKKRNIR